MDGATGLTYMQQRYYDQSIGRFLSVDPVVADSNTGASFNRYRYAANNPFVFVDPDGRQESFSEMIEPPDSPRRKGEEIASKQGLGIVADFTPVVGDIKAFKEAYDAPSVGSYAIAVVGLFGPIGDGIGKYAKFARAQDNAVDVSRALRPVGSILESVYDVIASPRLLEGKSLNFVRYQLRNSPGWVEGSMNRGRNAGSGWTFRQMNSKGTDFTDLYIQYHPGSARHPEFPNGYWKVSSGAGGTVRIPAGKN